LFEKKPKKCHTNGMLENEDQELIQKYLSGDNASLGFLIKKYLGPIYGFAYRYTNNVQEAEDITQETYLRVWKHLKKFDKNKNFKTWLFTIAKNASLDFLKKKKTISFSAFDQEDGSNTILDTIADDQPLPDEIISYIQDKEKLKSAMEKLSPTYRAILNLYYDNEFNFREISEITNEPLNTVKSRHRRAIAELKKYLT